MHGGPGALPHRDAGFEAAGCTATLEPSRIGRLGVAACPTSRHSLELVRGVTGLQGTVLGPTSREEANLQVGPKSSSHVQSF
jgi:hypothetical protein